MSKSKKGIIPDIGWKEDKDLGYLVDPSYVLGRSQNSEYLSDFDYEEFSFGALIETLCMDGSTEVFRFGLFCYDLKLVQIILLQHDFREFRFFIPLREGPMKITSGKYAYGIAPRIDDDSLLEMEEDEF